MDLWKNVDIFLIVFIIRGQFSLLKVFFMVKTKIIM